MAKKTYDEAVKSLDSAGLVDIVPTADVQKKACQSEYELRALLGLSREHGWAALCEAAIAEIEKLRGNK